MKSELEQFISYIRTAFICFLLLVLIAAVILIASVNPNDYAVSLQHKINRLETIASPRLIIVGGSSAALGIDSPRIEKETGLHPINMGLYGAVGLRFMLLELDGRLRSGDIVVIAPEYQTLQQPSYGDGFHLLETLHANPNLIKNALTPRSIVVMLRFSPSFLRQQVQKMFAHTIPEAEQTPAQKMASLSAFNEYGDVRTELAGDTHMEELSSSEAAGVVRPSADSGVLSLLRSFIKTSEENGIDVYLLPPSLPASVYNANRTAIASQDAQIREVLTDARMLGKVEDFVFPSTMFLDIEHPNQTGKEQKTRVFIMRLQEARTTSKH